MFLESGLQTFSSVFSILPIGFVHLLFIIARWDSYHSQNSCFLSGVNRVVNRETCLCFVFVSLERKENIDLCSASLSYAAFWPPKSLASCANLDHHYARGITYLQKDSRSFHLVRSRRQ